MKRSDIIVGHKYQAEVSGKSVVVQVEKIRRANKAKNGEKYVPQTVYDVVNLSTRRLLTFTLERFLAPVVETRKPPKPVRQSQPKTLETEMGVVVLRSAPALVSIDEVLPNYTPSTALGNEPDEADDEPANVSTPVVPPKTNGLLAKVLQRPQQTDTAPHLIVEARAGTGKTTTLVEGLKRVKGLPSSLIPSSQQAAVWDCMALSAGKVRTVGFCAFNKSIAMELQQRVPQGCDAMTLHSLGFKAVNRAFSGLKVNSYRVSDIISELLEADIRELRREDPVLLKATEDLVNLCKMNLTGSKDIAREYGQASAALAVTDEDLDQLASYYEIDLNGSRRKVFDLVPRVLERCLDPRKDTCVDFADMIWLPVALDLPVFRYDLLLVDEFQDTNKCQQALAKKAGDRLIMCGDAKQSIYGFAGADCESMPRAKKELGATPRGCITLPLTVTRRCGKAIVREAQRIVPDFAAFDTNPEGEIGQARYPVQERDGQRYELPLEQTYIPQVQDGDFVLCRVNAPLVSQCFRFLKMGKKANIQGRDVGQGLISTIKKLKAVSIEDLVGKIDDWLHGEQRKENAKRNPSEARLIALQDRADCLLCFTGAAATVEDVIAKIESIFTDDKNGRGIRLSSVHKAKGMEADSVFFLMPKGAGCPHPMAKGAWQQEQEQHILYVGITRARHKLVYVR